MSTLALIVYGTWFVVAFVLRTAIQKRRTGDSGIRPGVLGAAPGSLEWLAGWMLILAVVAGLAAPILDLAGLDPVTDSAALAWAGLAVALLGIALTFVAQLHMGREWRVGVDTTERTNLVTVGAFGLVRNPIFATMLLTGAGLAMMVPNEIAIVGFGTLLIAIELQVRFVEEPYLRTVHGDTYADYEATVGRFVPGLH